MDLHSLNALDDGDAGTALLRCCGSTRWAAEMAARRPFTTLRELQDCARQVWQALSQGDWLEAFAAHPRIGDLDSLRAKYATAAWSTSEQAGVMGAAEATLQALAAGNRQYEERFGHIFIVCASGKSAAEMLALLEQRLGNSPEAELAVAAGEQEKITQLRLDRLTNAPSPPARP